LIALAAVSGVLGVMKLNRQRKREYEEDIA